MTSKKANIIKERKKALAKVNRNKILNTVELTQEERIEDLEGKIHRCECDLEGNFKDNSAIIIKLVALKERLKNEIQQRDKNRE